MDSEPLLQRDMVKKYCFRCFAYIHYSCEGEDMGDPDFLKHVIKTTRKKIKKLLKRVNWLDQATAQRSHDELHAYLQEYLKLEKTIDRAEKA